jgi:hypothetical protein
MMKLPVSVHDQITAMLNGSVGNAPWKPGESEVEFSR